MAENDFNDGGKKGGGQQQPTPKKNSFGFNKEIFDAPASTTVNADQPTTAPKPTQSGSFGFNKEIFDSPAPTDTPAPTPPPPDKKKVGLSNVGASVGQGGGSQSQSNGTVPPVTTNSTPKLSPFSANNFNLGGGVWTNPDNTQTASHDPVPNPIVQPKTRLDSKAFLDQDLNRTHFKSSVDIKPELSYVPVTSGFAGKINPETNKPFTPQEVHDIKTRVTVQDIKNNPKQLMDYKNKRVSEIQQQINEKQQQLTEKHINEGYTGSDATDLSKQVNDLSDYKNQLINAVHETAFTPDSAKQFLSEFLSSHGVKLQPRPDQVQNFVGDKTIDPNKPFSSGDNLDNYDLNAIQQGLVNNSFSVNGTRYDAGELGRIAFQKYQNSRNIGEALSRVKTGASSLEEEAIKYWSTQDENIKNTIQQFGGTNNIVNMYPKAQAGELVDNFVHLPDIIDHAQTDADFAQKLTATKNNIYFNFPDYGRKKVAQILAQERENRGMNSHWYNAPSSKVMDALVDDLVQKGQTTDGSSDFTEADKLAYQQLVRPHLDMNFVEQAIHGQEIPTTGVVESGGRGLAGGVNSTVNTMRDLVENFTPAERLGVIEDAASRRRSLTAEELQTVTVNPKGVLSKTLSGGAQFLGYMLPMIAGGELGKTMGLTQKASMILTNLAMFAGDNYDRSTKMYPTDNAKQLLSFGLGTAFDTWAGELLPANRLTSSLSKEFQDRISKTLQSFSEKAITADQTQTSIANTAKDLLGNFLKENTKSAGVLTGFNVFHNTLNNILGGQPRDVSSDGFLIDTFHDFATNFLNSTMISGVHAGMGAYGNAKLRGKILSHTAENADFYKSRVEDNAKVNPDVAQNKNEIIHNLNEGQVLWSQINNPDANDNLTQAQKEKYLLKGLQQKVWERRSDAATDDVIKADYQKKADAAKKEKEAIWKGEDNAEDHIKYTPQEPTTEFEWKSKIASAKTEEEKNQIDKQYADWLSARQTAKNTPNTTPEVKPIVVTPAAEAAPPVETAAVTPVPVETLPVENKPASTTIDNTATDATQTTDNKPVETANTETTPPQEAPKPTETRNVIDVSSPKQIAQGDVVLWRGQDATVEQVNGGKFDLRLVSKAGEPMHTVKGAEITDPEFGGKVIKSEEPPKSEAPVAEAPKPVAPESQPQSIETGSYEYKGEKYTVDNQGELTRADGSFLPINLRDEVKNNGVFTPDKNEPVKQTAEVKPTDASTETKPQEPSVSVSIHDKPSMEYPVHRVEVNGKERFIQRVDSMNSGSEWVEVKGSKENGWSVVDDGNNASKGWLGFTKKEAVDRIVQEETSGGKIGTSEPATNVPNSKSEIRSNPDAIASLSPDEKKQYVNHIADGNLDEAQALLDSKKTAPEEAPKTASTTLRAQNISEIDNRIKNESDADKKRVLEDIKKVATSITKTVKDAKITIHDTRESFKKAYAEAGGGDGNARGFFSDADHIHINLQDVNDETAFHEGFHQIFKYFFNNSPEFTDRFHKQLQTLLPDSQKTNLNRFVENGYPDADEGTKKEEFVTEFFARVASGKIDLDKLPQTTFDKIKELIRKTAEKIGLNPKYLGLDSKKDIVAFAKRLNNAFNEGKELKGVAKIKEDRPILIKSQKIVEEGVKKSNAVFRTEDDKPIGFNYDTDQVARDRFNIPKLTRISAGSDRVVFDLGDNTILKIAKTARGLEQNIHEGSWDLVKEGILPEVYERGLNYIVAEKVEPAKRTGMVVVSKGDGNYHLTSVSNGYQTGDLKGEYKTKEEAEAILDKKYDKGNQAVTNLLHDLSGFTQKDFDHHSPKLEQVLEKHGLEYLLSYDVLSGDLQRSVNWGIKDNKPIHLDGGTFGGVRMINDYRGKKDLSDADFRNVYYRSKEAKKEYGDTDKFTKFQNINEFDQARQKIKELEDNGHISPEDAQNAYDRIDARESAAGGEKAKKEPTGGSGAPPNTDHADTTNQGDKSQSGITRRTIAERRDELNLGDNYRKDTITHAEIRQRADKAIKDGFNPKDLVHDILDNKEPATAVENEIMGRYIADREASVEDFNSRIEKDAKSGKDVKSLLAERDTAIQDLTDAHNAIRYSRSETGRALGYQPTRPVERTLSDYFADEADSTGTTKFTKEQVDEITKHYQKEKEISEKLKKKLRNEQAKNRRLRAKENVEKQKKIVVKKENKSNTDYKKERLSIADTIRNKLMKLRSGESDSEKTSPKAMAMAGSTPTPQPSGGGGNKLPVEDELRSIAGDVNKYIRSLVEENRGMSFDGIVNDVHTMLQGINPDVTKDHVVDLIAGEYNPQRPLKSEVNKHIEDLRIQADLIKKYQDLLDGKDPTTARNKIRRNSEIENLQSQIKDFRRQKREAEKAATVSTVGSVPSRTPEQIALDNIKRTTKAKIDRLNDKMNRGDYTPDPPPVRTKLDKEAQDLKDELIKVKLEWQKRIQKNNLDKKGWFTNSEGERSVFSGKAADVVTSVANVPRTIMATADFSAPLRQGAVASAAHPIIASKAAVEMFRQAFSEKRYDRWLDDVYNSPHYHVMKEAGLYIADKNNLNLAAREEVFMSNLAEKIPLIGKVIEGSERAYTSYLNKLRVDIFMNAADSFMSEGKTIENNPELYKSWASFVNASTGRGNLHKFEEAGQVLNTLLFSPRLIASRINLLTDFVTLGGYGKVPKEIRVRKMGDLLKFIGVGATMLTLTTVAAKSIFKDDDVTVEADPRSTDFGKIKIGETRIDVWAGFQQYVRVISQIASGATKSTTTGEIHDLNTGEFGARTTSDVVWSFAKGKFAPIPSLLISGGDDALGRPQSVGQILENNLTPLLYQDIKDAEQDGGVKRALFVAVPSMFGVGVNTYKK